MSGAAEAAEMLRSAVLSRYVELRQAVDAMADAVVTLSVGSDLSDVMLAADRFSLACGGLEDEAYLAHVKADKALAYCMDSTSAPPFRTTTHTVSTRRHAPAVEIPDVSAVPDEFMVRPDPKPDKIKIRAHLQTHTDVNWATLREDAGVSLQRRSIV